MALLFALNSKGLPRLRNASNHLLLLFVLTFMNARLSLASPFFIPTVRAQVLQTKNVTQTFSSSKQETSHSHHHNTAWAGGVYGVNGQQSQPQVSAPPIPQVVPERQPQPQPVPQVVPQAVPQPIPEPVPQTLPQAIPQPVPQPVPQNVPQQIPQAVNGVYAPPQPGSGYYVPLQPVVPVQPYYVPQSGYSVEIEARKRKRAAPKTTTKDPNRWHRLNVGYSGTGAAGPARKKQNMGTTTKGPTKDPLRWHRLNMGAIGKK